jgi:hypothetical protein
VEEMGGGGGDGGGDGEGGGMGRGGSIIVRDGEGGKRTLKSSLRCSAHYTVLILYSLYRTLKSSLRCSARSSATFFIVLLRCAVPYVAVRSRFACLFTCRTVRCESWWVDGVATDFSRRSADRTADESTSE